MFKDAVITAQGLELDAKILAGHASAIFTGIKIGDGVYAGTEDLTTFTAMRSIRQEFAISSVSIIDNNTVRLRSVVNNTGIANGYHMSELGVFAQDPDKGEILYSIALGIKNKMDYQPSETDLPGASSTIDTLTVISNSKTATIKMGMGAAASAEDLEEVRQGKVDIVGGDISETVIETLEPIDTNYPIPSAGETIKVFLGKIKKYIGDIKPLNADLAVYVATTGSDTLGDGTSAKPYRTINYALSKIPKNLNGFAATIHLAAGFYVEEEIVEISGFTGEIRLAISGNILVNKLEIKNSNVGIEADSGTTLATITTQYLSVTNYSSLIAGSDVDIYTNGLMDDMPYAPRQCCIYVNASSIILWGKVTVTRNTDIGIALSNGSNGFIGTLYGEGLTLGKFVVSGSKLCCDKSNVSSSQADWLGGGIRVNPYGAIIGTLQNSVTLYVAATGSDTTGDGTSAKPYQTIQYAINTLPKDLGGHTVNIRIADGVYTEQVLINIIANGNLIIEARDQTVLNSACSVGQITIGNCTARIFIKFLNIFTTTSGGIDIYNSKQTDILSVRVTSTNHGNGCIYVDNSACNISGCLLANHSYGIAASGSRVFAVSNTGTNDVGVQSANGADVTMLNNSLFPLVQQQGGRFSYDNGTQISNIITGGISCTWGTLTGGYVRHGNLYGTAMITVQMGVVCNTVLSANTYYTISGFPTPATPLGVAVTCHTDVKGVCYIHENSNVLRLQVLRDVPVGYIILLSCTYLAN